MSDVVEEWLKQPVGAFEKWVCRTPSNTGISKPNPPEASMAVQSDGESLGSLSEIGV